MTENIDIPIGLKCNTLSVTGLYRRYRNDKGVLRITWRSQCRVCKAEMIVEPSKFIKGKETCLCSKKPRTALKTRSLVTPEVGVVFGKLTVLGVEARRDEKNRQTRWAFCECSCGVKDWYRFDRLRHGTRTSCGCNKTNAARTKQGKFAGSLEHAQ